MIDNWNFVDPKWHEKDTIPFRVSERSSLYATAFLAFDWDYESRNDLLYGVWKDSEEQLFESLVRDCLSDLEWGEVLDLTRFLSPLDSDLCDHINLLRARVERRIFFNR